MVQSAPGIRMMVSRGFELICSLNASASSRYFGGMPSNLSKVPYSGFRASLVKYWFQLVLGDVGVMLFVCSFVGLFVVFISHYYLKSMLIETISNNCNGDYNCVPFSSRVVDAACRW
jgi:hypothetical protein